MNTTTIDRAKKLGLTIHRYKDVCEPETEPLGMVALTWPPEGVVREPRPLDRPRTRASQTEPVGQDSPSYRWGTIKMALIQSHPQVQLPLSLQLALDYRTFYAIYRKKV